MKILMLTNAMNSGGAETHILTLCRGLQARGHETVVASSGGGMTEQLAACGVRHVCMPLHSLRPDRLLAARHALARLLDGERFDVVHAHARIPAFLVADMARRRGLCFVTTAHADFSPTLLRRRLSRWGYATVAVSEDIAHTLCVRYGLSSSQITVIRNGVDTARFSPTAQRTHQGLRLLFMSRLDRDCAEGARLLCRLAPRLQREIPGLTITIVGGGDALPEIAAAARHARERGAAHVRVTGYVADPRGLIGACDVFLGVSRAALEAMACGRCVILGGDEGFFGPLSAENAPMAAWENFCARSGGKMTEDKLLHAIRVIASMSEEERLLRGRALRAYVERAQCAEDMVTKTEQFYFRARKKSCGGDGRVLLCGYYGYGNLGDDALLTAAIARAGEQFPGRGIAALTRNGARDAWRFGVPCIRRRSPWCVLRALRRAEVLVFGGGTLLQDATSARSLWYYTSLIVAADRRGVACELWANGIGPLTRRGSTRRVADALARCRYIGLRDGRSWQTASAMLKDSECRPVREDDLALGTLPADGERIAYLLSGLGRISEKGAVLIVLKGGAAPGSLRAMESWLCSLRGEGYTLLFASLYPREDDALTDRTCARHGGVRLHGVGAADLVGLLPNCRAVCSMRLHALVFAATAGVPFVGFGTDEKIASFCRERGGVYYVDLYGKP